MTSWRFIARLSLPSFLAGTISTVALGQVPDPTARPERPEAAPAPEVREAPPVAPPNPSTTPAAPGTRIAEPDPAPVVPAAPARTPARVPLEPLPATRAAEPHTDDRKGAHANPFVLASNDGAHRLEFKGLVHADGRFFLTDERGVSTFVLRRVRPAIDAKVFGNYELRFQADFAGSRVQALDAYANVHFWDEVQLRVGKGKGPVGLERLQSPRDMLFAERAFPTLLVPNRDVGAQLHGKVADGLLEWAAGVYNGVPNGGSGDADSNDSKDLEARVFLLPFQKLEIEALRGFGAGFAATWGNQFGATPSYVTSGQQTFFAYSSGASAFGERTVLAPQAYYYGGPVSLLWELVRVKEHLENFSTGASGTVGTTAWQIAGSLTVGGKPSYKGVKVSRPLDPENGGFGALELAGRYHDLRVGDLAFERNFANRSTAAQRASAFTIGATWHLANGYRALVNYESTKFRGGSRDGTRPAETLLVTRLQASF